MNPVRFNALRIILLCAAGLLSGCAVQQPVIRPDSGLPEEVIASPPFGLPKGLYSACVFRFAEPDYAPGVGLEASRHLYHALLKSGLFFEIALVDGLAWPPQAADVDLIITGRVLYFFEGGDLAPSRVDQEMQVIDAAHRPPVVLSNAVAMDISRPVYPRDLIFIEAVGAPAMPAGALLQRNAAKFSALLLLGTKGFEAAKAEEIPPEK